jgi:hypothetical protein
VLEDRTMPSVYGLPFTVNQTGNVNQSASAGDSLGDTLVAWTSEENSPPSIKARLFDEIGNYKTDEFAIQIGTNINPIVPSEPAVAMNRGGDFVVTWTQTDPNTTEGVWFRLGIVHGDGSPVLSPVRQVGLGHESRVGIDNNGDFVVSYTHYSEIRVARYLSDGTLVANFSATGSSPSWSSHASSIACAPDGGFALAYQTDFRNTGNSNVFLKQYDINDVLMHSQQGISPDPRDRTQAKPSVAVDDLGNPVLAFQDQAYTGTNWILAVAAGARYADLGPFTLLASGDTADVTAAVAADPRNSNYVVAYKQHPSGGGSQVWVTEVSPSGTTSTLIDDAQDGSIPAVSVNTEHRFIVTYTAVPTNPEAKEIRGLFGQLNGLPGSPVVLSLGDHVLTVTGDDPASNTLTISNWIDIYSVMAVTVNNREFHLNWADASAGVFLNGDQNQCTFNVENVSGAPVTVNTGTGNDLVSINGGGVDLASFDGPLTINGQGGTDTLQLHDGEGDGRTGRTYNLQDHSLKSPNLPNLSIDYSSMANVELAEASTHWSHVNVKGAVATSSASIKTGIMADNSVVVDFTAGNPIPPQGLSVEEDSGGNNTLALVGNGFRYETDKATGPRSGSISLTAGGINPTYTLSYDYVTSITDLGVPPSSLLSHHSLSIYAPSTPGAVSLVDGPVVNGIQTSEFTSGHTTPISTPICATLDFARRDLTINNGNTVTLDNPHPALGLGSLKVNGGARVNVTRTNVATELDGNGPSLVNVGGGLAQQHILSNLSVRNRVPSTTLNVDDSGDSIRPPGPVTLSRTSLTGLSPGNISFDPLALSGLTVLGGPGGDTFTVSGVPPLLASLIGGPGSTGDELIGPNNANLWQITGLNAGQVGNIVFHNIENLMGGTGIDAFKFHPGGRVTSIRGGGNLGDWLDYSLFPATTPVQVNLATGSATDVGDSAAGAVLGIQNVRGGAGNDTLTGNDSGNILIGGASTNVITGGSGRSILIGGTGKATITGGPADDILVAGATTFDANETALNAILKEWQRIDKSYAGRIADLTNGGGFNGSNKLIWGSTVLDNDSAAATLTGGPGLDWFFANLGPSGIFDHITDLNTGGPEVDSTNTWTGNSPADRNWSDPRNWSLLRTPGPSDFVSFAGGWSTSNVDAAFTIAALTATSSFFAALNVNAPLTITGDLVVDFPAGGQFGGDGAMTLNGTGSRLSRCVLFVGAGGLTINGRLTIDTGTSGLFANGAGTLTNNGTILEVGSNALRLRSLITFGTSETVNNRGLYDFASDCSIDGGTLNNSATGKVGKTGGSGTSFLQTDVFNNQGGTLEVTSGTLAVGSSFNPYLLNGAALLAGSGATLTNAGVIKYGGMITGSGLGTITNGGAYIQIAPGGATFNMQSSNLFQWRTGGTIDVSLGSLTNASTSTLNFDTSLAPPELSGRGTLTNNGVINETGSSGAFILQNGATLVNRNTYNLKDDAGISDGTFSNSGTLQKTAGTGTSTISSALSNTGTLLVSAGTVHVSGPVTQISGGALNAGHWTLSVSGSTHAVLTIDTGFTTIGAHAVVTLNGTNAAFTNLSSLASILAGGGLLLEGNASLTTAGSLMNNGKLTLDAGSTLTVDSTFTQTSTATLTVQINGISVGKVVTAAGGGGAHLGGTLALTVSDILPLAMALTILDDGSSSAIGGIFAGLPEGSTISVGGHTYTISYVGGDGNDVRLTRIS